MGLYNPNSIRKGQGLCKPNWNKRAYLNGPLSSYFNKKVEKENPNPRKFHKVFFLKPCLLLQRKRYCCISYTPLGSITNKVSSTNIEDLISVSM